MNNLTKRNTPRKSNTTIRIKKAKTHNLKNISLEIKKNKLIVISGVSGSGKSSLAFDTLFAEGQRRYIESLSAYARQFLGKIQKPQVEDITGICPAIAIEQKTIINNPRSTISTNTEIYDYLKILFSRSGKTISPISKKEVKKHQINDVISFIEKQNNTVMILAKSNQSSKNMMQNLIKKGFSRVYINDAVYKIKDLITKTENTKQSSIYIVIDRIIMKEYDKSYVVDSIETAFSEGEGECVIKTNKQLIKFSNKFELDGIIFEKPNVNLFSFNNPYGACKKCQGFGSILGIEENKVIKNPNLSVYQGVVNCWSGKKLNRWKDRFIKYSVKFKFPIHKPYNQLITKDKKILWNGKEKCKGINQFFQKLEKDKYKIQNRVLIARYRGKTQCDQCNGSRLRKESLYVKVSNKDISDITRMRIKEALVFFNSIKLNKKDSLICSRILKEIITRLHCLNEMGLGYLTLDRKSNTLSGGESQRINLAKSIGSSLVGSMYILDEPSIGLHSKDTKRLIKILKKLRDIGNTVIIVEHDEEIMMEADEIIDIGPGAGIHGGNIMFQGHLRNIYKQKNSLTANYLSKTINIPLPKKRKKLQNNINISSINKYNLKNLNLSIPLDGLVLITGVSGSGKSTLVKEVIKPAIENYINGYKKNISSYEKIKINTENLNKIEFVNQNPIGRSSRSNPATYTKVYDDIRKLFCNQTLAQKRNYKPGFFSFNTDGGRCDYCKGEGEIRVEMQFMADVHIQCEECKGKRFKQEVLDVKFSNKNICEILNLSVEESIKFFEKENKETISDKLKSLDDVGLGYMSLGQSSSTLSGGEAQRIKLASFLTKKNQNEKTIFIFDEPTTGLHFHDINKLLNSFYHLIEQGNSIICIEHNLDVIKCADWIIDLGPGGGDDGGYIVFEGTPEEIIKCKDSITGKYLINKLL